MSEKHQNSNGQHQPSPKLAIPFFLVLGLLSIVSFIIPLRPTQSYIEKRNLAEFPSFSVEALVSGDYFDDISTWFSDTFPGRESWIMVANHTESYHGHSDILISGDLYGGGNGNDNISANAGTVDESDIPEETVAMEEDQIPTDPEDEWGGVDFNAADVIKLGAVIQIGDSLFNQLGYDERASQRYAEIVSGFAADVADLGVRVISAPPPTAVGVMVETEYLEQLNCADQNKMLQYMHSLMSDNVVTVDTYAALVDHNDEYIYFRTDHHWTALGAYYCYEALCETLGMDAVPLSSFDEIEVGEFEGTLYWQCSQPSLLSRDIVYAYDPPGDVTMMIYSAKGYGYEWPVLTDMTGRNVGETYLTFIRGDNALTVITNNDLPDAPDCVVIKDSFGNCYVPYLSQNYHNVYVIDYRYYYQMNLVAFVEQYGVEDVIFMPYMIATQSHDGNTLLYKLCT